MDSEQKGTKEAKDRRDIAEAQVTLLRNGQPILLWGDARALDAASGWFMVYPISE